jgi:hypothetical protein
MSSRPTLKFSSLTLRLLLVILAAGCKHDCPSVDTARLDIRLTGAKSPEEVEDMLRASLVEKYSSTNIAEGYTIYQVTNGQARWVFAKVYNAPKGLSMFNLYCYEQEGPESWPLRAYVPLNTHYYTDSDDSDLTFHTDHEYVKAIFRGKVIFTGISKMGVTNGSPKR